jgi:hypothetical protein
VSCEPLLYRDIVVQNAAELEEWAMRYLQLEVVGAQPSTWTCSLSVSAKWSGPLTSALLLLPRLGSLHAAWLSQHPVPAPVFDALVKYTQPTLAFLSLHVAFAADAPAPRLHLLDDFAALRTLALHLGAGPARAGSVQGLDLPTLTTLHLTLEAGAPLQLLARSRFAALSALTLAAPALRRHDGAQLAPFLATHRALRTATLHVRDSTLAALVAGGLRATHITCDGVPPPVVLGAGASTLSIVLGSDAQARGRFRALVTGAAPPLAEIALRQWRWADAARSAMEAAGAQLGLAVAASVRLAHRGVRLVDEDGRPAPAMWDVCA